MHLALASASVHYRIENEEGVRLILNLAFLSAQRVTPQQNLLGNASSSSCHQAAREYSPYLKSYRYDHNTDQSADRIE